MPVPLPKIASFLGITPDEVIRKGEDVGISPELLKRGIDRITCEFFVEKLGCSKSEVNRFLEEAYEKPNATLKRLSKNWKAQARSAYKAAIGNLSSAGYYEFSLSTPNGFALPFFDPRLLDAPERRLTKLEVRTLQDEVRHYHGLAGLSEDQAKHAAQLDDYQHAGLLLSEASDYRMRAYAVEQQLLRRTQKKIRFTDVSEWDDETTAKHYFHFSGISDAERWTLMRMSFDEKAVQAVKEKTSVYLSGLASEAVHGSIYATRALAEIATTATQALNALANDNSKCLQCLQTVAMARSVWPVIYSDHPRMKDNTEILAPKIKLGDSLKTRVDLRSRYDPNHPFSTVASRLVAYIQDLQQAMAVAPDLVGDLALVQKAAQLPPLTRDKVTYAQWSKLAWEILLARNDPWTDPQLKRLVPWPSHRKTRAKLHQKFFEKLSAAIKALSPS